MATKERREEILVEIGEKNEEKKSRSWRGKRRKG